MKIMVVVGGDVAIGGCSGKSVWGLLSLLVRASYKWKRGSCFFFVSWCAWTDCSQPSSYHELVKSALNVNRDAHITWFKQAWKLPFFGSSYSSFPTIKCYLNYLFYYMLFYKVLKKLLGKNVRLKTLLSLLHFWKKTHKKWLVIKTRRCNLD